jgi:hypothetical protein
MMLYYYQEVSPAAQKGAGRKELKTMEKRRMEGLHDWQQYVLNREELEEYCTDPVEEEIQWAVLEIFPEEKKAQIAFLENYPTPQIAGNINMWNDQEDYEEAVRFIAEHAGAKE